MMRASNRRAFLQGAARAGAGAGAAWWLPGCAAPQAAATLSREAQARPLLKPPRLKPGDTIGLVSPSHAVFERQPYEIAHESLRALGFQVREGPHLRDRRGYLAGRDADRAADFNAMVADDSVHAILAFSGGSGANRILPMLDYVGLARRPKVVAGFSDVTALLNAITARTGLVTFHAPVASSDWNAFTVDHWRRVLIDGEAVTLRNPAPEPGQPVPKDDRITTLRGGTARGRLVGGNLAVLSSMAGSAFLPDARGAILMLEDTNEYLYRVDRMLSTLKLAGVLDGLAGVVLGAFTNCTPGEGYGALTLDEILDDWLLPLGIPAFRGLMFGHIRRKLTLPVGLPVEIDAHAGTLRLLEPAVA